MSTSGEGFFYCAIYGFLFQQFDKYNPDTCVCVCGGDTQPDDIQGWTSAEAEVLPSYQTASVQMFLYMEPFLLVSLFTACSRCERCTVIPPPCSVCVCLCVSLCVYVCVCCSAVKQQCKFKKCLIILNGKAGATRL